MEVDPMEYVEGEAVAEANRESENAKSRLNTLIAVTVALLATFMGICKVKDDNIVQQMQLDQAEKIDTWSWYQAKKTRLQFAELSVDQFKIQLASATPDIKPLVAESLKKQQKYVAKQEAELKETQTKAEGFQVDYDNLNKRDDQFDMSDAGLAIAIALLAVTSLTQKRWLFVVAMVPTVFGVIMGTAGLLKLPIYMDGLAKMLGP